MRKSAYELTKTKCEMFHIFENHRSLYLRILINFGERI